jgi:hypothetical protein
MDWDLGKQIFERQENAEWETDFIDQVRTDFKSGFPDSKGFSLQIFL